MNPLLEDHFQRHQEEIKKWYLSLKQISNRYYQLRLNARAKGFSGPDSPALLAGAPSPGGQMPTPLGEPGAPPGTTKHVTVQDLLNTLELEHGIRMEDCPELRRLLHSMGLLDSHINYSKIPLSFEDFFQLVGSDEDDNIIKRAFTGRLAIPNWKDFCRQMRRIYKIVKRNEGGHNATYIPQLAEVDPNLFGVSLLTIDGQRLSIGDSKHEFTIQSCSKIFTYCIASDDIGSEQLHRHVSYEPSGKSFNAFTLDHNRKPHNPLINSGAITTCSLIRPTESPTFRFNFIQKRFTEFAGGAKVSFDNATFLSERETADRNFALAHYMKENNVFPPESKLDETLDLYFQACSILVNSETLAVMASTLANGGTCPTTDKRVSSPQTVKNILQLAYSCGMYDFSGEWSVSVGLPAKSGVAGAIAVVVPGVMGLSVFSPRLDKRGNTVRGVDFCIRANKIYKWAIFDRLVKTGPDEDPNDDTGEHDVDHIEGNEDEDFMVPNSRADGLPYREGDRPPPAVPLHYGHGGAEAGQNYSSHHYRGSSSDDDHYHGRSDGRHGSFTSAYHDSRRSMEPRGTSHTDRDIGVSMTERSPSKSSSHHAQYSHETNSFHHHDDFAPSAHVDPLEQPQLPPTMNANQAPFLQEGDEDTHSVMTSSPTLESTVEKDQSVHDTDDNRIADTSTHRNAQSNEERNASSHEQPATLTATQYDPLTRSRHRSRSQSPTPPIKVPNLHKGNAHIGPAQRPHTLLSPPLRTEDATPTGDSFGITTKTSVAKSPTRHGTASNNQRAPSSGRGASPHRHPTAHSKDSSSHRTPPASSRNEAPSSGSHTRQYYTNSLSGQQTSSQPRQHYNTPPSRENTNHPTERRGSRHEDYGPRRRSLPSDRRGSPLILHHSNSSHSSSRHQNTYNDSQRRYSDAGRSYKRQYDHQQQDQQRGPHREQQHGGQHGSAPTEEHDPYRRPHKRPRYY